MIALHLIRAPMAVNALARWAGERGWVHRRGGAAAFDEGRALHHLIGEVFGPDAFRPFRLLVPPRSQTGNLYGYSASDEATLREIATITALPEHLTVLPLDRLAGKPMPAEWRTGQRLGFDVRVRPIRRLLRDLETPKGRFSKGAEVDAFLVEAMRNHPDLPDGMAREDRAREAVYLDWLAEKLAPAAVLDRAASVLARFHRTRAARGNQGVEGPDATIHGTLTVSDPAAFAALLASGIGRHRAFGFGMLLLRPPTVTGRSGRC
jgi:CRISPR system Cascade subunit CasE